MSILKKIFRLVGKLFKKPSRKSSRKKIVASRRSQSKKSSSRKVVSSKIAPVKTRTKTAQRATKRRVVPGKESVVPESGVKRSPIKAGAEGLPVGEVTHYFDKIKVCVVRIDFGSLKKGDRVLIRGKDCNLVQTISSMQIENEDVLAANKGQLVGLKVNRAVSVGSTVSHVNA